MSAESDFLELLRRHATDPAARGLADDAAVLDIAGRNIVLTCDTIVEGVHFLADDPPIDIGWKLAMVNLSDLAAKGARPLGALLSYSLARRADWDAAFVAGLTEALAEYGCPLLGGDTVALPAGAVPIFSLTAIGEAQVAPSRAGARPGDTLWLTGPVGDAGLGLVIARGDLVGPDALLAAYRRPVPHLAQGRALAPHVNAMMDVSDGLLLDAARMAEASGVHIVLDLARMPLSKSLLTMVGEGRESRLAAAAAGDDYVLLASAPGDLEKRASDVRLVAVGRAEHGHGLSLVDGDEAVPLPGTLGFEHGGS